MIMLMTTPEYYDNGVSNEEKIAGYNEPSCLVQRELFLEVKT